MSDYYYDYVIFLIIITITITITVTQGPEHMGEGHGVLVRASGAWGARKEGGASLWGLGCVGWGEDTMVGVIAQRWGPAHKGGGWHAWEKGRACW